MEITAISVNMYHLLVELSINEISNLLHIVPNFLIHLLNLFYHSNIVTHRQTRQTNFRIRKLCLGFLQRVFLSFVHILWQIPKGDYLTLPIITWDGIVFRLSKLISFSISFAVFPGNVYLCTFFLVNSVRFMNDCSGF